MIKSKHQQRVQYVFSSHFKFEISAKVQEGLNLSGVEVLNAFHF